MGVEFGIMHGDEFNSDGPALMKRIAIYDIDPVFRMGYNNKLASQCILASIETEGCLTSSATLRT